MELTQQIELTQESDENYNRVAFLGICGTNYPLVRGPNKIGRDPDTCSVVVNLNSISRLHAMIVIHKHECTLMDLGSSNKTQLGQKILVPYKEAPLKHGDAILFGRVAAVFFLVEEDGLAMTQAEAPDTPVPNRHVSKLNTHTTIPESPDISDKDESLTVFKTPKPRYQASNKIDNAYWACSKKSDSVISEANTSASLNNSIQLNIYDMETQLPCDNIICTKDDQDVSLEIHNISKIDEEQNVQLNLATDNKENENNQCFDSQFNDQGSPVIKPTSLNREMSMDGLNTSQVISLDEIEDVFSEHSPQPQSLVESKDLCAVAEKSLTTKETVDKLKNQDKQGQNMSNDTMDSDDDIYIAMTQNIPNEVETDYVTDCEEDEKNISKKPSNDCETDCEDDVVLITNIDQSEHVNTKGKSPPNSLQCPEKKQVNMSTGDFKKPALEDMLTQLIEVDDNNDLSTKVKPTAIEDMLTQIIQIDKSSDISTSALVKDEIAYCPTQVLEQVTESKICIEEPSQQIYSEEVILFKKPKPLLAVKNNKELLNSQIQVEKVINDEDDDNNYYAATQQLYEDLCSQREITPEIVQQPTLKLDRDKNLEANTSNENKIRKKLSHETSENDIKEKVNSYVSNLTNSQIMEVIGVDKTDISLSKNIKRDSNQVEFKKEKIKESIKYRDKNEKKTSLSLKDCQSNNDKKSKRSSSITKNERKSDIRLYLNNSEAISTRSSTRVRKSKPKICDDDCKNLNNIKSNNFRSNKKNIDTTKYNEKDNIPLSELKNNSTASKSITYDASVTGNENQDKEKKSKTDDNPRRSKRRKKDGETEDEKNNNSEQKDARTTRSRSKKSEDGEKISKSHRNKNKEIECAKSSSTGLLEKNQKSSNIDTLENKTKSSRSRDKKRESNTNDVLEKKQKSSNTDTQENKTKNSRPRDKKLCDSDSESVAMEIRRSKRQKATSDSGIESSSELKRGGDYLCYPEAKRSKSASLRSTSASRVKTQYVLFTVFPIPEVKEKLETLGAVIVSDVTKCTVVLTSQIRRTVKLLCAVGLGKPIVGPAWVQACVDNNTILDPWLYLMKDSEVEQRFEFNLEACLKGKRNFLSGYNVSSTPNVSPQSSELKLIVECSGGRWKEQGPLWVCVSSRQDSALWPALKKRGAVLVSSEFILAGALRQKLEIIRYRLD